MNIHQITTNESNSKINFGRGRLKTTQMQAAAEKAKRMAGMNRPGLPDIEFTNRPPSPYALTAKQVKSGSGEELMAFLKAFINSFGN